MLFLHYQEDGLLDSVMVPPSPKLVVNHCTMRKSGLQQAR